MNKVMYCTKLSGISPDKVIWCSEIYSGPIHSNRYRKFLSICTVQRELSSFTIALLLYGGGGAVMVFSELCGRGFDYRAEKGHFVCVLYCIAVCTLFIRSVQDKSQMVGYLDSDNEMSCTLLNVHNNYYLWTAGVPNSLLSKHL
jgi:hypothetical protein